MRTRNHRKRATKNKQYRKSHATKSRKRDIDQIQDDLKKETAVGVKLEFEYDEDLPGLGQFYCTPCGRHFVSQETLTIHEKSKIHKTRFVVWIYCSLYFVYLLLVSARLL
jgi:bud site selection protein 20